MKQTIALIERCLREGSTVDIDGVGSFELDSANKLVFEPTARVRVFLAYADEDYPQVKRLYDTLRSARFEPWMDKEKLLPGQNWPRAIERSIELCDFFICCFSSRSVGKRGHFQHELRYAMDVAKRLPIEEIFLMPVRFEMCEVPHDLARDIQYVDLFPDWNRGVQRLIKAMWGAAVRRNADVELSS